METLSQWLFLLNVHNHQVKSQMSIQTNADKQAHKDGWNDMHQLHYW